MNGLQVNSITGAGTAAAATIASALAPKRHTVSAAALSAKSLPTAKADASTTATATTSGTITSTDFMTLLVSELKNQDPTQPTDPNAYISQLVGVNSLQQLISINQGLTSIEPPATASS